MSALIPLFIFWMTAVLVLLRIFKESALTEKEFREKQKSEE